MLWTILIVLAGLWLLGVVTRHTLGGLIHGLPVMVVVLLGIRLASGMVQTSLETGGGILAGTPDSRARHGLVHESGVTDAKNPITNPINEVVADGVKP
jgi:hypothetical protein